MHNHYQTQNLQSRPVCLAPCLFGVTSSVIRCHWFCHKASESYCNKECYAWCSHVDAMAGEHAGAVKGQLFTEPATCDFVFSCATVWRCICVFTLSRIEKEKSDCAYGARELLLQQYLRLSQ